MSFEDPTGEPFAAPVITAADPDEFPYSVFHRRHPKLFAQVRAALPYGPGQLEALRRLEWETLDSTIGPLDPGEAAAAGDHAQWAHWGAQYIDRGLRWTDAPFLFSESYFYRRLLSATGYFAGAWRGVDPFGPMKAAGLAGPEVDRELAAYGRHAELSPAERDAALLTSCLWGNRADLGFQLIAGEPVGVSLLADDNPAIWAHLDAAPGGRVNIVADNAAEELLPDLLLIDRLLNTGRATDVVLYLKPRPYYVSDAMAQDATAALRRLVAAPGAAGEAGRRLWECCTQGRLVLSAPDFFCSPLGFRDLPKQLVDEIAGAKLTIFKGDLNYRRLVGDRLWPATTPFAALTAYLPGPVAALRTCKSDVAVGLSGQTVADLDAAEPDWRFAGRHAVIQFAEPTAAGSR